MGKIIKILYYIFNLYLLFAFIKYGIPSMEKDVHNWLHKDDNEYSLASCYDIDYEDNHGEGTIYAWNGECDKSYMFWGKKFIDDDDDSE
ncbi:hypothetical protein ABE288_20505 [Bacillus salipaludis]|uniref:hypothetical protein n=1 Tax=Bacillus salipaludis TaxID=2547811 RepID=UPI003D19D37C